MSGILLDQESPPIDPLADTEALYEIVRGEIVEKPEMGIHANLVAFHLARWLAEFVEAHRLGTVAMEAMFVLEEDLRRRPDVAFVSAERWPLDRPIPESGDWEVVPDLAIEVISPHDTIEGMEEKFLDYFQHGVREVWTVHTNVQLVRIYTTPHKNSGLAGDSLLTSESLLPGFSLPLKQLFRRLPTRKTAPAE